MSAIKPIATLQNITIRINQEFRVHIQHIDEFSLVWKGQQRRVVSRVQTGHGSCGGSPRKQKQTSVWPWYFHVTALWPGVLQLSFLSQPRSFHSNTSSQSCEWGESRRGQKKQPSNQLQGQIIQTTSMWQKDDSGSGEVNRLYLKWKNESGRVWHVCPPD